MKELQFNSMNIKDPQWAAVKIDLSSVAGAADLGLSFFARETGSSHGGMVIDLSGDGAIWKEAMQVHPTGTHTRFGADLDAALARAGIALDADVYVRVRHLGLIQDLFIDDFQIVQGVDVLGPRILTRTPTAVGSGAGPLKQIRVTFDEAINPATFSAADVRLVDPWGLPVAVIGVAEVPASGATSFDVTFPDQTTRGVYTLTVGPNIADTAGNLMNGDGDIIRVKRRMRMSARLISIRLLRS